MDYALVAITHGDAKPLPDTLASFGANVSPKPSCALIWWDGGRAFAGIGGKALEGEGWKWDFDGCAEPRGFCASCRSAWEWATHVSEPYVFWLEHDFRFLRPVDLRDLAHVLDTNARLAQMALMRDAVNEHEKAAGGLFESRHGQFRPWYLRAEGREPMPWLEHRSYFTTNVNLMRTEFMRKNPWPDYPSECEGRFGIDLAEREYSFGVWGGGEPWVTHVGTRTGFGY